MRIQQAQVSGDRPDRTSGIKRACVTCAAPLRSRRQKFCSLQCKNRNSNSRNQNYLAQQARGLKRKRDLVAAARGSCCHCGYSRNLAALAFHHRVPATKSFNLDLRALSNHSRREIDTEFRKCDLLCANCHAELHNPTAQPEA
jgi:hypothetical protein